MIVTVTLNPSLDLTYRLAEERLGAVDVHRAPGMTTEASGKGVNVTRDLHAAGVATTAVLPSGGPTGRHVTGLLADAGVPHLAVPVHGETRVNTSLLLPPGTTVKVNGPGGPLSRTDVDAVLAATDRVLAAPRKESVERWLVLSGSLAPGVGAEVVREFVELAHRHTVRCAVDASGPALDAALSAGADLLAPNQLELADLIGVPVPGTVDEVARMAVRAANDTSVELLVSMGGEGAIHTDGEVVVHGAGPVLVPVNTAGAGDAFLAGWLAGPGSATERMARAMAWGRSACLCPTTVDLSPGSQGGDGITVTEYRRFDSERERSTP